MDGMRIGIGVGDEGGLDAALARFKRAEADGFAAAWTANIFGLDAMTLLALAGRETSRIELGTAVVPTYSRHPFYMAQQALTTQVATGGRFVCGLGPSHKIVIENMLGLSYEKVARHVREFVGVMRQLLDAGQVQFEGETYKVQGALQIPTDAPPLLIGALGPMMRRVAGELCDGTITWMTGRRTLAEEVGPGVRKAAESAGRAAPRVVAGLPICVTEDAEGARKAADQIFAMYGTLPSYRAMLDAEGLAGPGDIAVAGDEQAVETQLRAYAEAGVTDLNAAIMPFGDDASASIDRTWSLLAELARR